MFEFQTCICEILLKSSAFSTTISMWFWAKPHVPELPVAVVLPAFHANHSWVVLVGTPMLTRLVPTSPRPELDSGKPGAAPPAPTAPVSQSVPPGVVDE